MQKMMVLFFMVLSLSLVACQSSAPVNHDDKKSKNKDERVRVKAPAWNEMHDVESEKVTHPVVDKLLVDAILLREQGNYSQAIIKAERALTIDAKEPKVYLELGRIRQAQGELEWAKQLLLKAKRFSNDKKIIKEINNELNKL